MRLHRTIRIASEKVFQLSLNTAVIALLAWCLASAAQYDATVGVQSNYQNWGWDSTYVLTNNLVTMAVVPAIGARIMQYDIGPHPSIWVNPVYLGQTFYGTTGIYPNYGGYKMWVAPQASWNAIYGGVWPPPSMLDFYKYSSQVIANSADSCVLRVVSQVDTDTTSACTGLQFSRTMTLFQGSSRVLVVQTVTNKASTPKRWSIWDDTEVPGSNPPAEDYSNFWAYYPRQSGLPPDSAGCIVTRGDTSAQTLGQSVPNVAPGVNGFNYAHRDMKIGARSDGGWLAFSDDADGFMYVKMFSYDPSAQYPDSGSTVEVYAYGDTLIDCVELEVLGPMADLAASGGSTSFTIDWYAAHVHGPVIGATRAGVVCRHLAWEAGSVFTGKYGPFYSGRVDLRFDNSAAAAMSYPVSPLDSLQINEAIVVPAGATRVALCLYNSAGALIDTLDKGNLADIGVIARLSRPIVPAVTIAAGRMVITGRRHEPCAIAIVTLAGSTVWSWNGTLTGSDMFRLPSLAKGSYLVRVKSGSAVEVLRMVAGQSRGF